MLGIVTHTPLWVFALFALLLVLGLNALRTRAVPPWQLLIVPLFFIVWGGFTLVQRAQAMPSLVLAWLIAAALGAALAPAAWGFEAATPDRARNRVRVRGSAWPLIRNLGLFAVKYALTAAMAVAPRPWLPLADIAVSGLSAGYFLGWTVLLARAYRTRAPLTAPPALP